MEEIKDVTFEEIEDVEETTYEVVETTAEESKKGNPIATLAGVGLLAVAAVKVVKWAKDPKRKAEKEAKKADKYAKWLEDYNAKQTEDNDEFEDVVIEEEANETEAE